MTKIRMLVKIAEDFKGKIVLDVLEWASCWQIKFTDGTSLYFTPIVNLNLKLNMESQKTL